MAKKQEKMELNADMLVSLIAKLENERSRIKPY